MSDAARELVEEALTRIGRIALGGIGDKQGYIFYANDVRLVLDELAHKVRLDEAKWWRDHWNETDWLKVCRHRITKLEQAAGGSAAAVKENK